MSGIAITGWGVVSPPGTDCADVTAMYPEPLPSAQARAAVDFSVRAELGRKGTSFYDRRTALTVVACGRALEDAGLEVDDGNRRRIGVVLGTTAGSVKSSVDYAVESFTQSPPYLVNPALFPNTVMNCAAGQSAIWFGLNGVNATVAGGQVAFLSVLRYCANMFRSRQADFVLAGAVEEFTPHSAWMSRLRRPDAQTPAGEGAAMFVLRPAGAAVRADGEVLGVALGFCLSGTDRASALVGCIRRALLQSGMDPDQITLAATGLDDDEAADEASGQAVCTALGHSNVERLRIGDLTGDCQAATGAFELVAILARHREDVGADGRGAVLTAQTREGAVGAAVVRGWSRGADRG